MNLQEQLGPEWYELLGPLFAEPWMEKLGTRIQHVAEENMLQPDVDEIFRAYRMVQPSQLKVLILGQDPYPNGQADGLAFSTKQVLPPKTLRIVFEELERTGYGHRARADLTDWAEQGVMLLNTILTVTLRNTLSHKSWGWERFIAATLDHINDLQHPLVVMAWGRSAQELIEEHIMEQPHRLILRSCHPVAESYSEGRIKFVGCGHFEKANHHLIKEAWTPIHWNP